MAESWAKFPGGPGGPGEASAAGEASQAGKASVVQGIFPLVFVILFLSSAFFPANLMLEPAASVAKYNPISFIVEGVRDPVISSLSLDAFGKAIGSIAFVCAISVALSAFALRKRLQVGG